MFLHNNHELFLETVYTMANELELPVPITEKDYYVTMILKSTKITIIYSGWGI